MNGSNSALKLPSLSFSITTNSLREVLIEREAMVRARNRPGFTHPGGVQFAFADGPVRMIRRHPKAFPDQILINSQHPIRINPDPRMLYNRDPWTTGETRAQSVGEPVRPGRQR